MKRTGKPQEKRDRRFPSETPSGSEFRWLRARNLFLVLPEPAKGGLRNDKNAGAIDWIIISGYLVAVISHPYGAGSGRNRSGEYLLRHIPSTGSLSPWRCLQPVFNGFIRFRSGRAFNYGLIYFAVAGCFRWQWFLWRSICSPFLLQHPHFYALNIWNGGMTGNAGPCCRGVSADPLILYGCVFYSAAVMFETMFGWVACRCRGIHRDRHDFLCVAGGTGR